MAKSSTSFTSKTAKVVARMGGKARWAKTRSKAERRAHALKMLAARRDRRFASLAVEG